MSHPLVNLVIRWSVLALGVMLATKVIPGIGCDEWSTLFVVVVLLSFFNAILKPLLVLFTLPFLLVTMGLGLWLINALLFLLVAQLVKGFEVTSFWSALGGAAIVSLTNIFLLPLLGGARFKVRRGPPGPPGPPSGGGIGGGGGRKGPPPGGGDVIDV